MPSIDQDSQKYLKFADKFNCVTFVETIATCKPKTFVFIMPLVVGSDKRERPACLCRKATQKQTIKPK